MNTTVQFMTPPSRLVFGSLYEKITTSINGDPLTYSNGKNKGQPRGIYLIYIAIPKGRETDWTQTEWGAKLLQAANQAYYSKIPQGFAWKVSDGDSKEIPRDSTSEVAPCEREGYPGHWIMKLSSDFPSVLTTNKGTVELTEVNAIKPGDYIQVFVSASCEARTSKPGLFLNHANINLIRTGKRISSFAKVDSATLGFSDELPAGAEIEERENVFAEPAAPVTAQLGAVPATTVVKPYTGLAAVKPAAPLAPPPAPPPAPGKRMTSAATYSYEDYIAAGWNDATLIQHGLMYG
jgi:hypothetical protein